MVKDIDCFGQLPFMHGKCGTADNCGGENRRVCGWHFNPDFVPYLRFQVSSVRNDEQRR